MAQRCEAAPPSSRHRARLTLAINLMGNALRDWLDPHMERSSLARFAFARNGRSIFPLGPVAVYPTAAPA